MRMKNTASTRRAVLQLWLVVGLVYLTSQFTSCDTAQNGNQTASTNATGSPSPGASPGSGVQNGLGLTYVPVDQSMYVASETIGQWSQSFNDQAISDHGWAIWAAINAPSGQRYNGVEVPKWETWFSEYEVFCQNPIGVPGAPNDQCASDSTPAAQRARPIHLPRQINTRASVVSFNKYNLDFKTFVQDNKYYLKETLQTLNASFAPNTPLQDRHIKVPPRTGIMLKPTFWIIRADQATPMPIWQGPGLNIAGTLQPGRPTDLTWTNIVLIDPVGNANNSQPITRTVVSTTGTQQVTTPGGQYQVVPLSSFYHFPLTEQDVQYLKGGNAFQVGGLKPLVGGIDLNQWKPGDKLLALLVGMHVTTAEWDDFWTWQTFWWTPNPEQAPPANVNLKPPFTNFNKASAYYMIGKDGQPHIAFNPHLETPIEGPIFLDPRQRGSHSNCMTCHRAAAFPSMSNDPNPSNMTTRSYVATGDLKRSDPVWFTNRVWTNNMWTMVLETQPQGWSPGATGGATPIQRPKVEPSPGQTQKPPTE